MLKVLMIGPDRSVHGGISGVVNNYYKAGLDKKVDLQYIGTMVEGSKLRKLVQAALAYVRFLFALPGVAIVHVNVASDASYVRKSFFIRTAHLFSKKIVIHQHGGDFQTFYEKERNDRQRAGIRKVFGMGDAFLVLAPFWKEFFGTIIDKNRITVLPDAIQIPAAKEKGESGNKVLFLGRLCKEKGIGELLACVPGIVEKIPDFHLYLGGIWEDSGLQKQAEQDREHVTWLGWLGDEEKRRWLSECQVFALPSYFEGQSVAILEAMAYRCGIVASDTGGIPQMIKDGETGILVQPKDVDSLQRGLLRVLEDKTLCRELGEKARAKAIQDFSMEQNMEKLLGIYREITGVS